MNQAQPDLRTLARLAGVLTLVVTAIVLVVERLLFPASQSAAPLQEALYGIAHRVGLIIFVVGFSVYAIYAWLWNWRPFSWLLRIPDLSGRWEGWYYRGLDNAIYPTCHEIHQSGLQISATAFGHMNVARGRTSALRVDSPGKLIELTWTYEAERDSPDPGGTHHGTHVMSVITDQHGNRYLRGNYYNDRQRPDGGRGAAGVILVRYAGADCRNGLNYRKDQWAMLEAPKELVELRDRRMK